MTSTVNLRVAENLGHIIFDYFEPKDKVCMQYLSKRFYHMFVPRMVKKVSIKPTIDEFLFSMHTDEQ